MWIRLFLLVVIVCGNGIAWAEDAPMRKVTFLPQWLPQAQFAGYYVAKEKGIYQKYRIEPTFLRGGPEVHSLAWLKEGKADFVSSLFAPALEQYAQGMKLRNIGQLVQKSNLLLVTKKKSGVQSLADFNGKRISVWDDFATQLKALIHKNNLNVTVIRQAYNINLFLRDAVDIVSAMRYNEYHSILNAGYDEDDLTVFSYDSFGLNFPEDGIYCLDETLKTKKELCCDFVKASLEGWHYAFDHPDEALDIVIKCIQDEKQIANRMHQKWMFEKIKDAILPQGESIPMGLLTPEDYKTVSTVLLENGVIDKIPEYSEFYENCAPTP